MSDFDWDDESEEQEIPQGPQALRKLYKKQQEEKRELESQLAALSSRVREQELSKHFAKAGIPEKAVSLFPAGVDPTEENIQKFVADYGGLFNMSKSTEEPKTVSEPAAQNVSADTQSQFSQMSQVTQTGAPSTNTPRANFEAMLNNPNLYDEVPHAEFLKILREVAQSKV
jgi:hypothetical protein